jgi:hypothetical protein
VTSPTPAASQSSISIDTSTTGATAGDVDLGNVGTVGDPIVTLTVTAGGGTTDGTVTFHGDAYAATIDIPSGGELLLSGTYNTGNNPWAIAVPARQTAHVVIITGTATLDFQNTLDGAGFNLTLQGDGLDFTGGADTVSAIGTLVMRPSAVGVTVDVGSGGGTGAGTLVLDATDLAALNTDIADGGGEAIRIGWDAADAPAGADGTAAITVGDATFQSPTQFVAEGAGGSVAFTGAFNGNDDATLDVDAAAITLGDGGGDSITTAGNTVRFGDPVTIEDDFTVTTGGGVAGNIDFDDTQRRSTTGAGGPWNLTLTAGTGDVTFGDAPGSRRRANRRNTADRGSAGEWDGGHVFQQHRGGCGDKRGHQRDRRGGYQRIGNNNRSNGIRLRRDDLRQYRRVDRHLRRDRRDCNQPQWGDHGCGGTHQRRRSR